ncbi:MAG: hypothetical protein ACXW2F_09915 [Thermoanaerobaculia bacterium]
MAVSFVNRVRTFPSDFTRAVIRVVIPRPDDLREQYRYRLPRQPYVADYQHFAPNRFSAGCTIPVTR